MFWCKVDVNGFVSEARPFDGSQSQPAYQPLAQMPAGYGPWTYNSGARTAVLLPKRGPRLPRDVIVDLIGLTNAQSSLILGDLNSPASGVGSPPKWQFSQSPAVWSAAPVFRNYSGTMQKEAFYVAVAFYCLENPAYLTSGVVASGVNIPGDQLI